MHSDPNQSVSSWIAAKSNVTVKNTADKLCTVDLFIGFRRLTIKRQLPDARVMLSSVHTIVPVDVIVFGKASQIEPGDYVPAIHRFSRTMRKIVFVGYQGQLAPCGQEEIPELRSTSKFNHLLKKATFLDVEYRIPCVIGDFISKNVYDGGLRTCHFIDIESSTRLELAEKFWLFRPYQDQNKSYHIITSYDAQRTAIETALKHAEVPWENKVINIDSFQVVRSGGTDFLENKRRNNVVLTCCKQSMIIFTSRAFMSSPQVSVILVRRFAASLVDFQRVSSSTLRLARTVTRGCLVAARFGVSDWAVHW
ncbi:hypothetical protein V8B97DRAFT_2006495 [Scleroderma yunnanense]